MTCIRDKISHKTLLLEQKLCARYLGQHHMQASHRSLTFRRESCTSCRYSNSCSNKCNICSDQKACEGLSDCHRSSSSQLNLGCGARIDCRRPQSPHQLRGQGRLDSCLLFRNISPSILHSSYHCMLPSSPESYIQDTLYDMRSRRSWMAEPLRWTKVSQICISHSFIL